MADNQDEKDALIQELQNKGLEFDGGMTVEELQAILDKANNYSKDEDKDWVEPIKSVDDAPTEPVTGATMRCWNCANHGTKSRLNSKGICEVCGFDVNAVYNGNIEAARAAQRAANLAQGV